MTEVTVQKSKVYFGCDWTIFLFGINFIREMNTIGIHFGPVTLGIHWHDWHHSVRQSIPGVKSFPDYCRRCKHCGKQQVKRSVEKKQDGIVSDVWIDIIAT